jgi:hypothetical protein
VRDLQWGASVRVAAEVTDAAYRVALRHGVSDKWLDLQLNLWEALTHAIEYRSCLHQMNLASANSSALQRPVAGLIDLLYPGVPHTMIRSS